MAFDACFLSHVINEINEVAGGGKVEKIYQPARDEFVFLIRKDGETHRLLINAGSRCPRISITFEKSENPANAPMLCMLLRKHLSVATLREVKQYGFERIAILYFDTVDEMGFKCEKRIIVEMMGKYSNIIFTDSDRKIINLLRQIDFSQSTVRQLLPGMIYDAPPAQDKRDPMSVNADDFKRIASSADPDRLCDGFIMSHFSGISPLVAREIALLSGNSITATVSDCSKTLTDVFFKVMDTVHENKGRPYLVTDESGVPKEYSFIPIHQYDRYQLTEMSSFASLLDKYFAEKSRQEKLSQRASDIQKLISSAETRITKKISVQKTELAECEKGEIYKKYGDIITANIYRLKKGMTGAVLSDYYTGKDIEIALDSRLTPAANAQRYYKKYSKTKSAEEHLSVQIASAEAELVYIASVKDSLSRAETEKELNEIRAELAGSGYASKVKKYTEKKSATPSYITFKTTNGYLVLCGKNNIANEYLTLHHSEKEDWWFHIKNDAGSHVILECDGLCEPPAEDFTDAAMIAAVYSNASSSPSAEVDYTQIKYIKKPSDSKPGYVIYRKNWSATVPVDKAKVENMRVK